MTATVMGWKHVFIKKTYLDKTIESLIFFQDKKDVMTAGYCIMPNHFHWVFKLPKRNQNIAKVIRTFKSYIATQVLKGLKIESTKGEASLYKPFKCSPNVTRETAEQLLRYFAQLAENVPDQSHRFWQQDSDLKIVESVDFLKQKLEYIHNNPVQPQWNLVENPSDYQYSSCRFYDVGADWNGIQLVVLW